MSVRFISSITEAITTVFDVLNSLPVASFSNKTELIEIYCFAPSNNKLARNVSVTAYSTKVFSVLRAVGLTIGKNTLCINVPLNCENMMPLVVESEIEFKVTIN